MRPSGLERANYGDLLWRMRHRRGGRRYRLVRHENWLRRCESIAAALRHSPPTDASRRGASPMCVVWSAGEDVPRAYLATAVGQEVPPEGDDAPAPREKRARTEAAAASSARARQYRCGVELLAHSPPLPDSGAGAAGGSSVSASSSSNNSNTLMDIVEPVGVDGLVRDWDALEVRSTGLERGALYWQKNPRVIAPRNDHPPAPCARAAARARGALVARRRELPRRRRCRPPRATRRATIRAALGTRARGRAALRGTRRAVRLLREGRDARLLRVRPLERPRARPRRVRLGRDAGPRRLVRGARGGPLGRRHARRRALSRRAARRAPRAAAAALRRAIRRARRAAVRPRRRRRHGRARAVCDGERRARHGGRGGVERRTA